MIDALANKKWHLFFIGIHILLGVLLTSSGIFVSACYLFFFLWAVLDVIYNRDKNSRAGFYAIYLMGFEIIYRMAGAPFAWELGKYVSIAVMLTGLVAGQRKYFNWSFVLLLILLIPAIFLTKAPDFDIARKMVLFNMSGPLTFVVGGFYFYNRPVTLENFFNQIKLAFLPAFTLISTLSVVSAISTIVYTSLESNTLASGGFGANQVSTVLGWFMLLLLLFKINGRNITPWGWLDWVMLLFIILRALLTFSRGGVLGSVLALLASVLVLSFSYNSFRKRIIKAFPYVLLSLGFLTGVFLFANNLTNNMLLYRYQGLTTNEMITGERYVHGNILTGRDEIIKAELMAFKDYPILGVGYGMGDKYRERYYGQSVASHTEYTRLLSEQGLLGLLFMVIGMIWLPLLFFSKIRNPETRCFFVAFYFLSLFTMFHAAMRLALPGVLLSAAFMQIITNKPADEEEPEKILTES